MRKKVFKILRKELNRCIVKIYSDKRSPKSVSCIGGNQVKVIVEIANNQIVPIVNTLNTELKNIGLKAIYGESNSLHTCYQYIRILRIEKNLEDIEIFCSDCDGEFNLSDFYPKGSVLKLELRVLDCPICGDRLCPCELCFYQHGLESDHKCWRSDCLISK